MMQSCIFHLHFCGAVYAYAFYSTHIKRCHKFICSRTDYAYPIHKSSFSLRFILMQSTALFVAGALAFSAVCMLLACPWLSARSVSNGEKTMRPAKIRIYFNIQCIVNFMYKMVINEIKSSWTRVVQCTTLMDHVIRFMHGPIKCELCIFIG